MSAGRIRRAASSSRGAETRAPISARPLSASERLRLLTEFQRALGTRARPVTIVRKSEALHQRVADRLLKLATFGGQDRYMTEYVTTLGHTIFVPEGWESREPGQVLAVLRHELVHVEQFERYGAVLMTLIYALVPFPFGLAYGRAMLELEAYRVTIEVTAELEGIEAATSDALRELIVARFTGPDYLYMWPFRSAVNRWVAQIQDDVRSRASLTASR